MTSLSLHFGHLLDGDPPAIKAQRGIENCSKRGDNNRVWVVGPSSEEYHRQDPNLKNLNSFLEAEA